MNTSFPTDAESLVLELLAMPGVSGQEGEVVRFIAQRLRQAGAPAEAIRFDRPPHSSPIRGEAGNLVLRLPGSKPGKRRLLLAHVDTVPLCRGARPVRRGRHIVPADKRTGLGADDRSGTAVLLSVALEILRHKTPHPPLSFLWTVQEEVGLYGARYARLGLLGRPHLAFNFDGGAADKVTIGATGGYRMRIRVSGVASHAGVVPEKGVSAIAIAALAIAQLHREGWHGRVEKDGRQGTSNVGIIHGGEATNVVTPDVEVRAEARSHDPAFRRKIVHAIEQAFRQAAQSVRNVEGRRGRVRIDGALDYESFRLRDDEPCVDAAQAAVRRCDANPVRAISDGGLDANWLAARGIPTVTLGCGQENGHTVSERLDLTEFRRACRIALCLATGAE
jgi:tripeptide aminopeptidase